MNKIQQKKWVCDGELLIVCNAEVLASTRACHCHSQHRELCKKPRNAKKLEFTLQLTHNTYRAALLQIQFFTTLQRKCRTEKKFGLEIAISWTKSFVLYFFFRVCVCATLSKSSFGLSSRLLHSKFLYTHNFPLYYAPAMMIIFRLILFQWHYLTQFYAHAWFLFLGFCMSG